MSLKKFGAAFSVLAMLAAAPQVASAATITIVGNSTGNLSTATGQLTLNVTPSPMNPDTLFLSLTNTSPFDARVTSVGFDLIAGDFSGNGSSGLDGFSGTTSNPNFAFSDGSLGNINQFNSAVLDFGFITGNSGNFTGGSPNAGLAPGGMATFTISGNFAGITEAQAIAGLFVRFQRVGPGQGNDSDVGRATTNQVPDVSATAPMLLLGMGLLAAMRARRQSNLL